MMGSMTPIDDAISCRSGFSPTMAAFDRLSVGLKPDLHGGMRKETTGGQKR